MFKQIATKLKRLWGFFRRDPWLVAKFATFTVAVGFLGKVMLIGAKDGADVPTVYAQFVPTLPIMVLSFLGHRYLWDHQDAKLLSYISGHWSKSYGAQFIAGHGLFILFAVWLGWYYLGVSLAIGVLSAVVTFVVNEWKIFKRRRGELMTATP